MGSVNQRMAVGAAWMIGFRLVDRGIGLVSTLILARLLVPADFGLLAMATSFIARERPHQAGAWRRGAPAAPLGRSRGLTCMRLRNPD